MPRFCRAAPYPVLPPLRGVGRVPFSKDVQQLEMRKEGNALKALAYFDTTRTIRKTLGIVDTQLNRPPRRAEDPALEEERVRKLLERRELCLRQLAEIEDGIRHYLPQERGFRSSRDRFKLADEQLYLDCRYLQDMTIEETADAMAVSRDTAYRIRRRIAAKELDPKTHRLRLQTILNGK